MNCFPLIKRHFILTALALLSITGAGLAQSEIPTVNVASTLPDTTTAPKVAVSAKPAVDWQKYLGESLKIPKEYLGTTLSIKIKMEFTVEKDGSLNNPKMVSGNGKINSRAAGKEQLKQFSDQVSMILLNSPKWQPALHDGIAVQSYFTLPFSFNTEY